MLSCKEVARILGSGEPLSFKKKLTLKLHLAMCRHCKAYSQQLKAIKEGFVRLFREKTAIRPETIAELESQILKVIKGEEPGD